MREIKLLKQKKETLVEEEQCIICCNAKRDQVFYPCYHMIGCGKCSKRLRFCPICNVTIEKMYSINKI